VIKAFALITRAGHGEIEAMRILNDALDLAVIKNEDVSVAAETLVKVLAGNSRALRELGITQAQYNAALASGHTQAEKYAAVLALVEKATAKGRDTTDSATQAQDRMTIAWQNLTAKTGPSILTWLAKVTEALTTGVEILQIYAELIQKIHDLGAATFKPQPGAIPAGHGLGHGPSAASSIAPNGGGDIHLHIGTLIGADGPGMDRLAREILQRARFAPGR